MNKIFILWAICFIFGISATTYLAVMDHPWFALFVLLVTVSLRVTNRGCDKTERLEVE